MRRGAVFYNIGRGTTVDQRRACSMRCAPATLDAAWLDVTDPEPLPAGSPAAERAKLLHHPAHRGRSSRRIETLVRHFLENFRRFLAGTPLRDRIM